MNKYRMCMVPAFPLENVQILKDRVVFPYVCFRTFGESLRLVTKSTGDYPYLSYLEGAELVALPEDQPHMEAAVRYVTEHAKETDLLFLFGARGEYMELADVYKSLRPDGIIYLKLAPISTGRTPFRCFTSPSPTFCIAAISSAVRQDNCNPFSIKNGSVPWITFQTGSIIPSIRRLPTSVLRKRRI